MKETANDKTTFLRIKKENAEDLLRLIHKEFKKILVIDRKKKILYEGEYVLFPLVDSREIIKKVSENISKSLTFDFCFRNGIINPKNKFKSINDVLINKISPKMLKFIPKSYDIIGNIAILEFDLIDRSNIEEISHFKKAVAEAVISINKAVKTVYEKKSEIKDIYRLRELNLISGIDIHETIYKENNCTFKLNVKNVYFTPRLVYERKRITSSDIKINENIFDLFAGVGTFSIQLAKIHNVKVFSFDINPHAYNYLKENIKLNKLEGLIYPYNLDIRDLINPTNKIGNSLKTSADRIIMNLPESSINYIDVACYLMKTQGGFIHIYQFCEKPNPIKKAINNIKKSLSRYGWSIDNIIKSKVVKAYSPKSDLIVVDLKIKPIYNKIIS